MGHCYVDRARKFPFPPMQPIQTSHLRPLLIVLAIAMSAIVSAQGKFTVNGRMKVEGSDLSGARAVVYKDGQKERTITSGLSKFSLDLDLNANYIIAFEKDGYVAKKISFNTRVPADAIANGFTPFDFAVSLFKQYDDINMVVFNQPVGVIRYESSIGDFDYDTDYTKSIQSQLQQALAEVEKKQKEEEQNADAEAKRAAEEAKQKAKAEAEAQKQAAAQQAAQARADAEAQKKAAADQAAQARADAEARKKAEADAKAEQVRQEAARKEEEERQAEAKREEERKAREARAQVVEEPKPVAPPPPRMERNTLAAKATEGEDVRRTVAPVMAEEASRMADARTSEAGEERPDGIAETPVTMRSEDLQVEPNKVTTIVTLETAGVKTEYRKVIHKWGGTFYFKDGKTCTQQIYEREALNEQLAGAGR